MCPTAKNTDYWGKRMASLEDDQYQRSAAYYKDVQRQYIRATNSIQMDIGRWYQRLADNNDISYAGAKKLLKKNELEEFKWTVEDYIKAGEENAVDQRWMKELENASARPYILPGGNEASDAAARRAVINGVRGGHDGLPA